MRFLTPRISTWTYLPAMGSNSGTAVPSLLPAQVFEKGVDRVVALRAVAPGKGGLPELRDGRAGEHGVAHLSGGLQSYLQVFDHEAEREAVVEGAVQDEVRELDLRRVAPPVARVYDLQQRLWGDAGLLREYDRLGGARERRRREEVVQGLDEVSRAVIADVEDLLPERLEYLTVPLEDLLPPPNHYRQFRLFGAQNTPADRRVEHLDPGFGELLREVPGRRRPGTRRVDQDLSGG